MARRPRPGVPLAGDEPQEAVSGAGQCRSGSTHKVGNHNFVPVKAADGDVLMPCSPKRARKLVERNEATPYWSHGIFCIRLDREPSARNKQAVVVGVDPGSKREGFSARSAAHDLLNIDADAKNFVGPKLEKRRILRRARRSRKTPCRSPKRQKENHDRVPAGNARTAVRGRHWRGDSVSSPSSRTGSPRNKQDEHHVGDTRNAPAALERPVDPAGAVENARDTLGVD